MNSSLYVITNTDPDKVLRIYLKRIVLIGYIIWRYLGFYWVWSKRQGRIYKELDWIINF